jgi:UDP-N-acetyl-D-mannosaminuronate dehydrogenase
MLGDMLSQDLRAVLQDANLVILATDHKEYQKLSQRDTGDAAVYDGRGILDGTKFPGRFASIGRRT